MLGNSTVTPVIVAIIVNAPNLAIARSLHLGSRRLGFGLSSLRHLGNFSSHRTTANTGSDSSKATIRLQFAPVRDTDKGLLETKGCSPRPSTFQIAETVAQVAA